MYELSNKKSQGVKGFAVFHLRPNGPNIETRRADSGGEIPHTDFLVLKGLQICLQCFDAVGWAAGRASGL